MNLPHLHHHLIPLCQANFESPFFFLQNLIFHKIIATVNFIFLFVDIPLNWQNVNQDTERHKVSLF